MPGDGLGCEMRKSGRRRVSERVRQALLAHRVRLFGYALSLAGDRETAEDLLQDCAVKALAAARVPADAPAVRAWLFRILRNAWIDRGRRLGQVALVALDEAAAQEAPDAVCDRRMIDVVTVRQALETLSPTGREVVALVDFAGFSYQDAAEILDVPVGTVMSRLSRARAQLMAAIAAGNVRPLATRRGRRGV